MITAGIPGASRVASAVAQLLARGVLDAMASEVGKAGKAVLDQLGAVITATTAPGVGDGWFRPEFHQMVVLGATVSLVFLAACAIQAVMRQDPGILLRALVVQLPLAVILTVSAMKLVELAETVVDQLARGVSGGAHASVSGLLDAMARNLMGYTDLLDPNTPVFLAFFLGLCVVIGALLLWIEMIVRSAAIDAAALFLPLALATMVWPAASHMARRLVEVLAALVLSKFVIVSVLALGASALHGGTGTSGLVTGAGLLVLATMSPFAILRLISIAEFGAVAHLEGTGRRTLTRPLQTGWTVANLAADVGPTLAGTGGGRAPGSVTDDDPGRALPLRETPTYDGDLDGLDHPARPPRPAEPVGAASGFGSGSDAD